MADLTVSNLNRIVQNGNIDELFHGSASEIQPKGPQVGEPGAAGNTFADILKDSVEKVNLYQGQADVAIKEMIAGRNKNIHETMLTIERADTSLKLMMQVRNKILDAYREIMRMQV